MPEFLRVVLCYSSKAMAASSHSFLHHPWGCLPGHLGNRRVGTSSWSPELPSPPQKTGGVMVERPDVPLTQPDTQRGVKPINTSASPVVAAREELKQPGSCEARACWRSSLHVSPLRLVCQRWDAGSRQAGGKWVPRGKESAGSAAKQGCRPAQPAAPASAGPGSDAAAQKLPPLPQGPGAEGSNVHESFASSRQLCQEVSLKVTLSQRSGKCFWRGNKA